MKSLSLSSPHIIAMVGMPGAGKTTFAEQFSNTFSAPLISNHDFLALTQDEQAANDIAVRILREVMKTKQTIVFDGLSDRKVDRISLSRIARENGYKTLFVWVQTDSATTKTRSLKFISSEDYLQRLKRFSAPHSSEPYVVISGKHTYASQARGLLKHLADQSRNIPPKSSSSLPAVPPRPSSGRIKVL